MREKSWRVRVVTCLLLWEYHTCTTLANRFVLRSLRSWRCLRKSAIIFWPKGESSDDDAGDGANESNARSREGVIGRRDFGFLDESAPEFVSLLHYIDAKEENTRMPAAFSASFIMFSLLPLSAFNPLTPATPIAAGSVFA